MTYHTKTSWKHKENLGSPIKNITKTIWPHCDWLTRKTYPWAKYSWGTLSWFILSFRRFMWLCTLGKHVSQNKSKQIENKTKTKQKVNKQKQNTNLPLGNVFLGNLELIHFVFSSFHVIMHSGQAGFTKGCAIQAFSVITKTLCTFPAS